MLVRYCFPSGAELVDGGSGDAAPVCTLPLMKLNPQATCSNARPGEKPDMAAVEIQPRIQPNDSIILLVDHQTTTLDWVKSLPKATVIASCRVLARMAVEFSIPLFFTTTMEEYVGPTVPEIADAAPDAFNSRFKRGGDPQLLRSTGTHCGTESYKPEELGAGRSHHRHLPLLGRTRCCPTRLFGLCCGRCMRDHVDARR